MLQCNSIHRFLIGYWDVDIALKVKELAVHCGGTGFKQTKWLDKSEKSVIFTERLSYDILNKHYEWTKINTMNNSQKDQKHALHSKNR